MRYCAADMNDSNFCGSAQIRKIQNELRPVSAGLKLAWGCSPSLVLVTLLLTTLGSALPTAIVYAGKAIIDAVLAHTSQMTLSWVSIELCLVCGLVTVQRTGLFTRNLLGTRLTLEINSSVLKKSSSLTLDQIENAEYYDRLNRASRESNSRPAQLINDAFRLLQNFLSLLCYIAVLFSYNPLIVLILFVAALPAAAAELRFSNAGFCLENWRSRDRRRLAYLEYVLTNETHAKEIRTFDLGSFFLGRYRELGERIIQEGRELGGAIRRGPSYFPGLRRFLFMAATA